MGVSRTSVANSSLIIGMSPVFISVLSSLAGHAYENPTDIYPTVESGPVRLRATGVGHPLIPAARCVRTSARFTWRRISARSPAEMSRPRREVQSRRCPGCPGLVGAGKRERAVESGEAEIVADRATDGDPLAVVGDNLIARLEGGAEVVGL